MANWTNIPDSVLEPGKPIRSVDGLALRDNPIALAEGSPGAPRIGGFALGDQCVTTRAIANFNVTVDKLATGTGERDWVGARYSALALGALGDTAMLFSADSNNAGQLRAGGILQYSNAAGTSLGASPAGTWMALGESNTSTNVPTCVTIWRRVA